MFLPTFFLTNAHISEITTASSTASAAEQQKDKEIMGLSAEINSKLTFYQSVASTKSLVGSLSKVVNKLPQKIKINSVSFNRSQMYKGKASIGITISGVAQDRTSLVNFTSAMKDSGEFDLVDVPVSSLTKDRELPFSMNVVIAP